MLKLFILLSLSIVFFLQTVAAFCGVTRTGSFQLSVTIPEHVMTNNDAGITPYPNNTFQIVQTQTVIRNNQSIQLTSIVVP